MKKIEGQAAMISAIALVISMFLNVYISFENNALQMELKHYETTFEAKQNHYSNYLIYLKNSFYDDNKIHSVFLIQHIDNLENELYQLQPFFDNQDEYEVFKTYNSEYTSFLLSFEEYSKDEQINYFVDHRTKVQNHLYDSLFTNGGNKKSIEFMEVIRNDWSTILTIVGVFGTLILVFHNNRQFNRDKKIARAKFWLDLESMFSKFDDLNSKLRNGGEWNDKSEFTVKEWSEIEDYMGLFEHCELMIQDGVIDSERFESIFLYRVKNLIFNSHIYKAKVIGEQESWVTFIKLLERYNLNNIA